MTYQPDQPQDVIFTGAAGQATIGNNLLTSPAAATAFDTMSDIGAYRVAAVQVNGSAGISAGAIIFEGSNDNTNFIALPYTEPVSATTATLSVSAITIAASTFRLFIVKLTTRYFRVRISTGFTGGTVQAIARFMVEDDIVVGAVNVSGAATTSPTAPSIYTLNTAATTVIAASIKTTAGTLHSLDIVNTSATAMFIKLYNKASAPAPATDVPILTFAIAAAAAGVPAEKHLPWGALGLRFATGIAIGVTGALGDTDTTAIAAGLRVAASYV
jgi:hypothetical protein